MGSFLIASWSFGHQKEFRAYSGQVSWSTNFTVVTADASENVIGASLVGSVFTGL
jgi:hypothetical protein